MNGPGEPGRAQPRPGEVEQVPGAAGRAQPRAGEVEQVPGAAGRAQPRPGDVVQVTVTYLEMLVPPNDPLPPPPAGAEVRHVVAPSVEHYRRLYDGVGHQWYWVDRQRVADEALAELLQDPRVEVHVLYVEGAEAGYVELDRAQPGEVRIMYFGLKPGYIGRGLGRWFLGWAVRRAWSYGPRRVWVDTCTLDHPQALPNYEKAGFRRYGSSVKEFTIPW